jgi:hypothetical protein
MKMIKSNLGTLMGGCLVLATLSFAPVAQSQRNATPLVSHGGAIASMETRSDFATRVENGLRQGGVDARVQLEGDRRDVLRVDWQGIRRRDIHNFVASATIEDAKRMGFSGIVFANGKQRWDYDLTRESMVWSPAQP